MNISMMGIIPHPFSMAMSYGESVFSDLLRPGSKPEAWCNRFQATISGKDYKRFLIEEDPEECPVLLKEPWPRTWRTWSSGVMKPGKSP